MPGTRHRCHYCFGILDPTDTHPELRVFVSCSRCKARYHRVCWSSGGNCLRCGGDQCQTVNVLRPAPLRAVTKTRVLAIRPSAVIYVQGTNGAEHVYQPVPWRERVRHLDQIVRAVMLAVVLVSMATLIGVFVYRVLQLGLTSIEMVMDAVFREQPPSAIAFISAFIGGVVSALVFYTYPYGKRRFVYFLAGVISLAGLDLVLFDFTPQDLMRMSIDLYPYREALCAQSVTALITLLMTPIHRKMAPKAFSPSTEHLPLVANLLGWTRLILVSLLLALLAVYLSTRGLSTALDLPRLVNVSLGSHSMALTLSMAGSFVSALAVAAVVYWPPKFRQVTWHFGIPRLLLALACSLVIGLMYRTAINPDVFLSAVITACLVMLLAVPVQRALS